MNEFLGVTGKHFEWANQTTLHPLGGIAVLVLGLSMLIVPRRYAVLPMIIMACFIAPAQRIVVLTLDFSLLRIMVLFGWVRVLANNETCKMRWKAIDTVLVLWVLTGTIAYTIVQPSFSALVNRCGVMFDAVGMYFLFRCLIRDWQDIDLIVRGVIVLSVPVAVAFAIEHFSGRNAFAIFGGTPEITPVREGRVRCQGAFSSPIMAGCLWASLMPLIAARWWAGTKERKHALIGLAASGLIVLLCASSTPVMAAGFAIVGACMYALRYQMRRICWGVVVALVALHVVMKAPVWHLISRIDVVGGSTGWQRYYLIDNTINRIGEWWLLGTTSTAQWGPTLGDITNQYVLEGLRGGLLRLLLFLLMIGLAFQGIGQTWRTARPNLRKVAMAWALGVSLFVHCMSYMAVSYFGQIVMFWFLLLAMIASLTPAHTQTSRRGTLGHDPAMA